MIDISIALNSIFPSINNINIQLIILINIKC